MENWEHGGQDYADEQDQFLRALRYAKAKREAEEAIRKLTACLQQRKILMAICFMSALTTALMAFMVATLIYGQQ